MIKLLEVMRKLRGDNGCPWDKKQTFDSLREYVIEEAYELVDAIEREDTQEQCEELGDLLLQIAFQAVIAEEKDLFSYKDVEKGICDKLIERHPHVFGEEKAENSEEVLSIWNKNKLKKKGSVTSGIPNALPALLKTRKVWKRLNAIKKIDVSLENDFNSMLNEDMDEESVGKVLFDITVMAENNGIDAETALNQYLKKFVKKVEDEY